MEIFLIMLVEIKFYNFRNLFLIKDMPKSQQVQSQIVKIQEVQINQSEQVIKKSLKNYEKQLSESQRQRKNQNTLSLLTKNFINLIKNQQNMTIDSNDAAKQLGIQKRRIYDITNVLQGIGYVQKIHKNKLRWVGGAKDPKISSEINQLDSEISVLQQQQLELTYKIEYLQKRIKNDFVQNKRYNYFRLFYFKEILKNFPNRSKRAVIVKASKETTITSHQNEQTHQSQIEMYFKKQQKGSVYYISLDESKDLEEPNLQKKVKKQEIKRID